MFNVLSHDKENEGEGGGDCYGPLDNLEDAAEMWDRKYTTNRRQKIFHGQTLKQYFKQENDRNKTIAAISRMKKNEERNVYAQGAYDQVTK